MIRCEHCGRYGHEACRSSQRLRVGDAVTVTQVREAFAAAGTVAGAARILGVCRGVASRWAREMGIRVRPGPPLGRRPRMAMPPGCDPWAASRDAIAAAYGVSPATVGRWRKTARRAA